MTPRTRKDEARRRGAIGRALGVLRRALGSRAESAGDRIRVARAYRVLGDTARAAGWYRSAVDALSERGEAVRALALAKELSEVVPHERRAFADLAARFSRDPSTRVAIPLTRIAHPLELPAPAERILDASELLRVHEAESLGACADPSGTPLPSLVPPDVLLELEARGEIDLVRAAGGDDEAPDGDAEEPRASSRPDPEDVVRRLRAVPLFSELDRRAFLALAQAVALRTVPDRELVFREGEEAGSFFLVAEGTLEAVRRVRRGELVLRRFRAGEPLGLFGLFAGRKRAASVRALGTAQLLEIPAAALASVVRVHAGARGALSRFFQQRLLEDFLASAPLLGELPEATRAGLVGQFRSRRLAAGSPLVSPGEVFDGLFLVAAGSLSITRRVVGGREQELARLKQGQFLGVLSGLGGTPCRCSISAAEDSSVRCLPQRAFNDLVRDHPELRGLPARLAAEGLRVDKDVFVGDAGAPGLA